MIRRKWQGISLRVQLVSLLITLVLSAMTVTGVGTLTLLRSYLMERLDSQLTTAASPLANQAWRDISGQPGSAAPGDGLPSTFYVLFMNQDGAPVQGYRSRVTPSEDLPEIPTLTSDEVSKLGGKPFSVKGLETSAPWRVTVQPLANATGSVAVALPLNEVDQVVDRAAVLILAIGFLTVTSIAVVTWFAVTHSFKPLRKVEQTASKIADGDLSQRVDTGYPPDTEVGQLSKALNTMLNHIEHAFAAQQRSEQQMRTFVADASHELRTPLVTVRGYSELYRQGALTSPEAVDSAMERIENESLRMGVLVENLLTLARLDENETPDFVPIDLLIVAENARANAKVRAPERTFVLSGVDDNHPQPVWVVGYELQLNQVLDNLLTNAIRYTNNDSPIEIAVGPVAGQAVIEVRDHGPGIPEDEADKVFERFYRMDSSRTRDTGGSGLGLAIVAAIVQAHHGTVSVQQTPGGGATFVISLPAIEEPLPLHDNESD